MSEGWSQLFDQFLSLLSSLVRLAVPKRMRGMGESWLSCIRQIFLSKLTARVLRNEKRER